MMNKKKELKYTYLQSGKKVLTTGQFDDIVESQERKPVTYDRKGKDN